jgi:hypothetical protein
MNLTFEEWAVVLTAIVALVGLGLSFYNFWQGRPRRRLEVSLGLMLHPAIAETIRGVIVKFINERGPVVVIEEVGFEYADGRKAVVFRPSGDRLPTTVPPGHSASYYYGLEMWRRALPAGDPIPVRAYCRDATGRGYRASLSREIRSALIE